jgi:hypothetical protein
MFYSRLDDTPPSALTMASLLIEAIIMTAFQQTQLFDTANTKPVEPVLLSQDSSDAPTGLAATDFIDMMLGQYRQREQAIMETEAFIRGAHQKGVMEYFVKGMQLKYGSDTSYSIPTDTEAAKAALRVEYWARLLGQAKIFEVMPAQKRQEARKQFSGIDCPPFDESTVRPTIETLLGQRKNFFAERVDGIFRALSGDHVTNQPWGFSKKLILSYVFDKFGYLNQDKAAYISDLRGVVGRLTGRGEPSEYDTRQLLSRVQRVSTGKKVAIDGGAFYLTVYKAGTAHFEVAPEVAVELNSILASLYPTAIPTKFRTPAKKAPALSFDMKAERLSMGVISILGDLRFSKNPAGNPVGSTAIYTKTDKVAIEKATAILESIGATVSGSKDYLYAEFDYEPFEVLNQIIFSGTVPEQVSYQFYATQKALAEVAASKLDVKPGMDCCEPSAGTGTLAEHLPKESTLCIELAPVRAKVLEAKGYKTVQADFLVWAIENSHARFDRLLMNPPFSKGRAKAHLTAAASLLKSDGRLVAILPASMINTTPLDGFEHEWSEVFVDQFQGTCVRVVILTATKKA